MSGATFEWKTDDLAKLNEMKRAKFKQGFNSSIFSAFGFRWYLGVAPNGDREQEGYVNLYLHLAALSPKIKSIAVALTFQCIETKTKDQYTYTYDKVYGWGWPGKALPTKDIQDCASLTFTVSMELIAVYDVNDDDVTDTYAELERRQEKDEVKQQHVSDNMKAVFETLLDQKLQMVFVRFDSLTTNMDKIMQRMSALEEQKERVAQLHQQMNKVEQQVNTLMLKDMDPEQQRFKAWMASTDCLSVYYDAFVSHGVTDFAKFSVLGMQDIKSIGVDDIQHQMLLLTKVLELNRNHNNNGNDERSKEVAADAPSQGANNAERRLPGGRKRALSEITVEMMPEIDASDADVVVLVGGGNDQNDDDRKEDVNHIHNKNKRVKKK